VTMRSIFAAAALGLGLVGPAGATTTYENTRAGWIGTVGLPANFSNGLWGQAFSAPGGNLQSFMLAFQGPTNGGSVTLAFNVSPWDGDSVTPGSSPLYTSSSFTLLSGSGDQELTFAIPNLALPAGQEFVAYVRVISVLDGGMATIGFSRDPSGLGGSAWVNGTPSLLEDPWSAPGIPHLYHRAVFADPTVAVPAPAAMSLLGLGVLGLVALRRRA
jgi:hypothetical protein